MQLPNFVVVGAAKSGTTSLYHCLRQHPEIFLPEVKEPHFFINQRRLGFPIVSEPSAYEALFEGATEPVRGEASTGYLYFPESSELIAAQIPDSKIIVMLRNPVDRAFSMWGHQIRENLERLTFEEALDAEEIGGHRLVSEVEYGFNYLRLGLTAERLARFFELFGRARVHVGFYEDWVEDPAAFLRRLFRFLGVDSEFVGHWGARHNASGVPRHGWLHRYLNSTGRLRRASVAPLRCVLPARVRHDLWRSLRDWNIRRGSRHVMLPATRQRLVGAFWEEFESLEKLLGRDLTSWRDSEPRPPGANPGLTSGERPTLRPHSAWTNRGVEA